VNTDSGVGVLADIDISDTVTYHCTVQTIFPRLLWDMRELYHLYLGETEKNQRNRNKYGGREKPE
jgi:hypothetical protein